jgi:cell division transport system permease protein
MIRSKIKRKLGSYPVTSVMMSLTVALFVIGAFGLFILGGLKVADQIRSNIEVQVYLNRDLPDSTQLALGNKLKALPMLVQDGKSAAVSFYSREEAAKKFIEETGEQFVDFLGENPLRDAYILKINPNMAEEKTIKELASEIEKMPGVFEVEYVESLISSINKNVNRLIAISSGLTLLLLMAVFVLVSNTLRLSMYSQRFLIRSMQLVGASSWFIIKPFVSRAFYIGLLAGALAGIAILVLMGYLNHVIPELNELDLTWDVGLLLMILIFAGGLLASLFALTGTKRYLGMPLDELY